jgi:hypothetical protein
MAYNNYNQQNRGGGRPPWRGQSQGRGQGFSRGRGSGDPDRLRLTGMWRVESYENGLMFRGSLGEDQIRELRLMLKRCADEGKSFSFSLFDNGRPQKREDPRFTLHASVYQPTRREVPREEPDDFGDDDFGDGPEGEGSDERAEPSRPPSPDQSRRREEGDSGRRPNPSTRNDEIFD